MEAFRTALLQNAVLIIAGIVINSTDVFHLIGRRKGTYRYGEPLRAFLEY